MRRASENSQKPSADRIFPVQLVNNNAQALVSVNPGHCSREVVSRLRSNRARRSEIYAGGQRLRG
jgi:hypothetical protein